MISGSGFVINAANCGIGRDNYECEWFIGVDMRDVPSDVIATKFDFA